MKKEIRAGNSEGAEEESAGGVQHVERPIRTHVTWQVNQYDNGIRHPQIRG